jgi:hypothetical protein
MPRSLIGQIVEVRTLVPIAGDFVHNAIVLAEDGEGPESIIGVVIINSTGVHYRGNVRHLTAGGEFKSLTWTYPINRDLTV